VVLKPRVGAPGDWAVIKCEGMLAGMDYDPFFDDMDEAVDFCNGAWDGRVCPIRHACLIFALTNNQKEGVWGGTTELTRRAIRKRWPLKGREPRPEWEWMTEDEAIEGVSLMDLLIDDDEDDDD
jgi:hypothetical protein